MRGVIRGASYAEVIRVLVFLEACHTQASHTQRSYVKCSGFFLINMPYAESYAESYAEVIRDLVFFEACHTQASHTRKPYAGIFLIVFFYIKKCIINTTN